MLGKNLLFINQDTLRDMLEREFDALLREENATIGDVSMGLVVKDGKEDDEPMLRIELLGPDLN